MDEKRPNEERLNEEATETDVAIVGCGPVGAHAARLIAERGYTVTVVEEHPKIGMPIQCAGLITPRVLELAGISDAERKKIVQSEIYGADMYTPGGHMLPIRGNRLEALSVDRGAFDRAIASTAEKSGAAILKNARASAARRTKNRIALTVTLKKGKIKKNTTINCKILIGADGFNSDVAKWFSFPRPNEIIYGLQADMENLTLDKKKVVMFLGKEFAPGLFAWIIPASDSSARVGLCVSRPANPRTYLEKLLAHPVARPLLKNGTVKKYMGGCIPIGVLKRTYGDNVMLVGDAAGQVKPTSAGGIYTGMVCAKHCAETAVAALAANDFSAAFLQRYQSAWESDLAREFRAGMLFRKVFIGLSDAELSTLFRALDEKETLAVIAEYGDIDYPSKVAMKMLPKAPRFIKFAPMILRSVIR